MARRVLSVLLCLAFATVFVAPRVPEPRLTLTGRSVEMQRVGSMELLGLVVFRSASHEVSRFRAHAAGERDALAGCRIANLCLPPQPEVRQTP